MQRHPKHFIILTNSLAFSAALPLKVFVYFQNNVFSSKFSAQLSLLYITGTCTSQTY